MSIGTKSTRRQTAGHVDPDLALNLAQQSVGLMQRQPDGSWREVASANLSAPDFARQLDDLRVEARVRATADDPILLWLPPEQVLRREYTLHRSGIERAWEARDYIAAESGHAAEDLMIACAPGRPGASATVLAALAQTIEEAQSYARSWGFRPGAVSTRVAADCFGETHPVFRPANPGALPALFRIARFSAAACVASLAFFGASALLKAAPEFISSADDATARGQMIGMIGFLDETQVKPPDPLRPVWTGNIRNLGTERLHRVPDTDHSRLAMLTAPPNRQVAAPEPGVPVLLAEMTVGPPPSRPSYVRPGRLSAVAVLPARPSATIRFEDPPPAATSSAAPIETRRDLFRTPPGNVQPLTGSAPDQQQASGTTSKLDGDGAEQSADATATQEGLNKFIVPRPRPMTETTPAPVTETASLAPVTELLPTPPSPRPAEDGASGSLVPVAALQTAPSGSSAGAVATLPMGSLKADEDAATGLAVLASPQPLTRPRALEHQEPVRATTVPLRNGKAPRAVQAAAARQGLSMSETSLIGILQGTNGRQAILRLEGGAYTKVREGDMVGDWRVGRIGREDLRLTRGGQNRVLGLVTR